MCRERIILFPFPLPVLNKRRKKGDCFMNGSVKWFNDKKGFGFIECDDGVEDVFVHQSNIEMDGFRTLSENDCVEFDTEKDERGRLRAIKVKKL